MVIRQGEVYWVDLGEPRGSEPDFRRPYIVIQNNIFNTSRINTVVVCSITSNLRRGTAPGNVLLGKGEANLPKKSVVNITQISTVDKSDLMELVGRVSEKRVLEILDGLILLTEPREV